jgi:hypothetical protein
VLPPPHNVDPSGSIIRNVYCKDKDCGGITVFSTETSSRTSSVAPVFLKSLTDAAMLSAAAGSEVTVTALS